MHALLNFLRKKHLSPSQKERAGVRQIKTLLQEVHFNYLQNQNMKNRIIGFDLARAYAILGMYIVNFNTVFGTHQSSNFLGKFLSLFNGNSSTIFVMLAGMGVALMSNRAAYTAEEKSKLKAIISKRSWFLFFTGLLLYTWWSADILHFYGGYMHFAILILFLPPKYYLWFALLCIVIFHCLFFLISYESGWNFESLTYTDFWTIEGFLRNTFYNGWNPIFPWMAYFLVGMWLGRLDWSVAKTRKNAFLAGLLMYIAMFLLELWAKNTIKEELLLLYFTADYLPPFIPFMASTMGFGLMAIAFFMYVGLKVEHLPLAQVFAKTGQMTLTHYISHLTLGMIIFAFIADRPSELKLSKEVPIQPIYILLFAVSYFALSCVFSHFWSKKHKHGLLETLMRKISG